jgi:DNA modification methylase
MKSPDKERYRSELKNIDWDFTGDHGDAGFATYHWYPARYVPQLPGILINYFSEPGDTVLDPFCGSGTTLIEAFKFGRRAVGIDLTPAAILMTRAKVTDFEADSFTRFKHRLLSDVENRLFQVRGSRRSEQALLQSVPNFEENSTWFHPSTLVELTAIWNSVKDYSDSHYFAVAQAAFSAILIQCCSQEKHWGWVCDNVKPKEFLQRNAIVAYSNKLAEYERCAKQLMSEAKELQEKRVSLSDITVEQGDCFEILRRYSSESFDLVVTSPPYFNVTDYVKSQRLSNLWLDVDTQAIKRLEIGARYKRERLSGLDQYLASMRDVMIEITRVVKRSKFCCLVLGESPQHEKYLSAFEQLCSDVGLEKSDSILRTISTSRRFIPSVTREKILIMKRSEHD